MDVKRNGCELLASVYHFVLDLGKSHYIDGLQFSLSSPRVRDATSLIRDSMVQNERTDMIPLHLFERQGDERERIPIPALYRKPGHRPGAMNST